MGIDFSRPKGLKIKVTGVHLSIHTPPGGSSNINLKRDISRVLLVTSRNILNSLGIYKTLQAYLIIIIDKPYAH